MRSRLFLSRTFVLLLALSAARAATVDENTTGPSSGGDGFWGESFITPASSSFNNIVFTFLTNFSTNDPFATGTGFLLSTEYLGPPSGLSNTTPGFLGQATASGNLYTFAPSITLAPNTTYYFYENASIPSGTIFGGNAYAGHQFYYSSASDNNFGGLGNPLNFRVTGVATTCASAPPNMIAWWPGDGNADDSVGGHNGSLLAGATFAPGEVDQAFSFDGAEAVVSVPDSPAWNFGSNEFTIDTWVKFNAVSGADVFVAHDEGGGASNKWIFWLRTGNLAFHINEAGGAVDINGPAFAPNIGQWYHVAVTRSGSTYKFYVDGAQLGGDQIDSVVIPDADAPLTLGHAEELPSLNGLLDEVEIFNRALDATEIASIYIAGPLGKCKCTPPPADMISWWPGDGNAHDIQDGNDGTLQNGATFNNGKVDQAFFFDGVDDYVDVGDVDLPATFTIDAWINPVSFSDAPLRIISKDAEGTTTSYSFQADSNGKLYLYVINASDSETFYVTDSAVISAGSWQHVAATYDGNAGPGLKIRFYVNGVNAPASTFSNDNGGTPKDTALSAKIGIFGDGVNDPFEGKIDELELFSRALSDTEVQAIYNAGSAGKCKPCVSAPANMISWWPGDGNANDIQDGNDGTLQNDATFAAGKVGQAFDLDGTNDYVSIGNPANLQTAAVSADAWIDPDSTTGNFQTIVSKWQQGDTSWGFFLVAAGGGARIDGYVNTTAGLSSASGGTIPVGAGQFTHVAMTYSSADGLRLYVNGTQVATGAGGGTIVNSSANVQIGADSDLSAPDRYFDGRIDEVEIFDRALSASEIQDIYNAGSSGKCKSGPTPVERQFLNISSRASVGTGENVAIAGLIIHGDPAAVALQNGPVPRGTPATKNVLIRGLGPSLNISGDLDDPMLELHAGDGSLIASNDDWQSDQQTAIENTGLAPTNIKESAILYPLTVGSTYTAILSGVGATEGIGLVEVYDLDALGGSHLANISTRAFVSTDDDVLIGGIIVRGGTPSRVVLRGIGPSLTGQGVSNALLDPILELHDGNGALIETNDDWQNAPNAIDIALSGLAPTDPKESAILFTPAPGNYTAIVSGVGATTGIGLVEAYNIGPAPP